MLKEILFWTWCLPQTLLGLVLKLIYRAKKQDFYGYTIYVSNKMLGGISLGKYIIVGKYPNTHLVKHEYGHQKQSFMLGPLYLLVIGLPSLIWCWVIYPLTNKNYYWFWTEKWANKLGE